MDVVVIARRGAADLSGPALVEELDELLRAALGRR
jgi:RNase P protein component